MRPLPLARLVFGAALVGLGSRALAEVPTGRMLEKVQCAADAAQTYAIYVPTRFERTHPWPVLFCFDPAARGKTPVERFQAAAEKFGWIVAGSNNSRNGPWEANVAAIQAMIRDVDQHLPIDRKRLYVAGLSGGARVACQLAVSGLAQGVIACSAGFMGSETPPKVSFPFFGTAGETDFNYRELRRLDRELEQRKAAHRIVIFDGGHEWLPASLAEEALAWLDLQAMRSGAQPRDAAWIQQQFATRVAALPAGPPAEKLRALKSITADFHGLSEIGAIEQQVKELSASREVREALKAELAAERAELALSDRLWSAATDGAAASERKTIAELQAKAAASPGSAERTSAQRVLQGVATSCSETAREAMRTGDYETAASVLDMAVLLRPERAPTHFDLARARASLGDRKRALAALRNAVAAGFRDANRIEAEKAFENLRHDAEFVAIVSALGPPRSP